MLIEIRREDVPLLIDLYELTMLQAYLDAGISEKEAVFEVFARKLPENFGFLVACGVDQAVELINSFKLEEAHLDFLRSLGLKEKVIEFLADFKFTGEVKRVREGEIIFANEPILQVKASIAEAQIFETALLNLVTYQTYVATKASRLKLAARGKIIADFGARRAPGIDASVYGARAAYIGGIDLTSNLLASYKLGIRATGTVAHSFIQAFEDEEQAFLAFAKSYGENAILLIDTYDVIEAARKVIRLAKQGLAFKGVRIDSEPLLELSRKVRTLLDEAGLKDKIIVASSGLDEFKIAELMEKNAPIDAFGVGTNLFNGPSISHMVYKLVEIEGKPVTKAGKKAYLAGAKQVYRIESSGAFEKDVISRADEKLSGRALLGSFERSSLEEARKYVQENLKKLPSGVKRIRNPEKYRVELSKDMKRINMSFS